MLRLSAGQRRLLIHVLRELANFGVISLLFGQFLGERPFSMALTLTAGGLWMILIGAALWLAATEAE
jgi:hypothetical protein